MVVLTSIIVSLVVLQGFVAHTKTILPEAITYAVANSFNNTANLVHVVIETSHDNNTLDFLDALDNLLGFNVWSFRLQIDINNKNCRPASDHNLWFIDSYKAFRRLFPLIENYFRDSQLFFLIVLKCSKSIQGQLIVMEKIFSDFLRLMIANVNLLIETASGEVSFYTFYPFQEYACRSAKPFKMYTSYQNSLRNSNILLFPTKANNLYECSLRLKTRNRIMLNSGKYEVFGLEAMIAHELASRMNFSYEIIRRFDKGHFLPNENSSEPHYALKNGEIDLVFGIYTNNVVINHFLSKSVMYLMSHTVIAFRNQPEPFNSYDWLLFPFDFRTWLFTLLSLVVISGGIFCVKKNQLLLNVMQLEYVGLLEILSLSIGSTVEHLPRKSCLRFVFIVFSFGTLILRTAYLGKLFDAYRGMTMEKQDRDFNQLLAENYTIFSHSYYAAFISELKTKRGNTRYVTLGALENLRTHSKTVRKYAIFTTFLEFYSAFFQENHNDWIFKIVFAEQISMYFPQHSILVPRINEIIERLEESGISHQIRKNYDIIHYYGSAGGKYGGKSSTSHDMALNFERFSFTFYLFIAMDAFACFVFIIEVLLKSDFFKITKLS
ncbi:uncharacterized protein LOC129950486 [Eupeodes corollae]|uniref:uncharacterized protein LOC129950486 n=1 Tax=Eupeodes corollae TaxID=290404 RepID=UPI002491BE13|nr:uncharacterized protein LOC129950486 [Eupeodes corollae]